MTIAVAQVKVGFIWKYDVLRFYLQLCIQEPIVALDFSASEWREFITKSVNWIVVLHDVAEWCYYSVT